MENNSVKKKKSFFDGPLFRTRIKSANAKLFPEGVIGYFIGPTLALLTNSILAAYLNQYMTDVLNMTTWAPEFFKWLPVVSVIFVVLGNIVVGRLMDKCKTKAGKARPLMLVAIPLAILALLLLFVLAPFTTDTVATEKHMLSMIFIAIGYNLWFAIAYPFYFTSHSALVNLSTRNSKDRSLLATIANATALAAMGASSMVLPFLAGRFLLTGDLQASYNAWKIFVIALIIVNTLGIIIEFYFTRERITEESFKKEETSEGDTAALKTEEKKKTVSLGQQIKACFKDKYWWIIIVFFFLYQLGGMLKNISQPYYCKLMFMDEKLGVYSNQYGQDLMGTLSIIGAIPTALGMVIAWPLSNKIGKGKAILFGSILAVIGGAIGFIAPTNFYVVVASFVIKALGSTPAMYLSLALLADVLDHQEAMHGFRTDGFTMTIYGAIMAGMTGIATGVLNIVLDAIGYVAPDAAGLFHPTALMQNVMPWVFIGGETLCYAVIVIIFLFMGVEKFTALDHRAIVKDQRAKAEAEGREYVDPATELALQEEESNRESEKQRVAELKAKCEKKGLNFEEEEAKYQAVLAAKQEAAEAKKAAADAKKKAAEDAKIAAYNALSEQQRADIEAKKAAKAEKQAKKDAVALADFNRLRAKYNQAPLEAESAVAE